MSEVRGKCEFCVHWPPTGGCLLPDYACIDHEQDSPQWTPTSAAQIALRLETDLAAARAELARHQPEERVGRCGCDPDRGMGWEFGVAAWDNDVCQDYKDCEKSGCPRDNDGDGPQCSKADRHNPTWLYGPDPEWGMDAWGDRHPKFCPECGWELCKDGIARRNADSARVARVREALLMPLVVPSWTVDSETFELRDCFRDVRLSEFADAIRAALDPPADPEVPDE